MPGLIEVIDGKIGNSIQDTGRLGYRHMGITVSGCLDSVLARCANALVGNPPECACIEIRVLGPTLQVRRGRVRVALAGDISATLQRADVRPQPIEPWTSITLDAGETLEIGSVKGGAAYLALFGGIDSLLQLGSRSTYQRALFGGIDGRPLMTGNMLPCASQEPREYREHKAEPWSHDEGAIRVMLGPQDGHFKPESVAQFLDSHYQVTSQMDRMGVRLEGIPLVHLTPEAADIVSDGVTPGAIQVPGNGQPIVLLADCQTVGGYPKIATVISADLPRLGQLKPGQSIRFRALSAAEAHQALLAREARWTAWAGGIVSYMPDVTSLYNDLTSNWVAPDW